MKKNSEKEDFVKLVIKHFLIMSRVTLLAALGLYIASLNPAIILHPNAYRDIIRSIIFVYIFFFCVTVAGRAFISKMAGTQKVKWNASNIKAYFTEVTPYEMVGITFTLITLVNSIMMLTGLDEPKQGVFAYVHLMTRLGIISLIISLIYAKEIMLKMKQFKPHKVSLSGVLYAPQKNTLVSVSKIFTNTVIIYSLTVITLQNVLDVSGGSRFYLFLLIIWGVVLFSRVMSQTTQRKKV